MKAFIILIIISNLFIFKTLCQDTYETFAIKGTTFMDNEAFDSAIVAFSSAIEINPTNISSYSNRGICKAKLNKHNEAIIDFNKALEIKKETEIDENFDYWKGMNYFYRAISKEKLNDTKGAFEDYSKAIEINPKSNNVYKHRGLLYFETKKYNEAISDFNKLIELSSSDSYSYKKIGDSNTFLGKYKEAIENYDNALKLDPDDAETYYKKAIVEYKLKEKDSACKNWEKAIDLGFEKAVIEINKYCQ